MFEANINREEKKPLQLVYEMIRTPSQLGWSRSSYHGRRRRLLNRASEFSPVEVKEGVEMIVRL